MHTAPSIRSQELHFLTAHLDRAGHDGSSAVVLVGEAGAGKSRLLEEFADVATGRDVCTVALDGNRVRATAPFQPLLDAVSEQWHTFEAAGAGEPAAQLGAAVREGSKAREIRLLFDVLVARLAAAGPVIVTLDGVPEAAAPLLDACAHVARRSAGKPVLVVVATRELDAEIGAFVETSDAALLPVEPLTDQEAELLVGSVLGDDATPELIAQVTERAGGNPLFLVELAAAQHSTDATSPAATLGLLAGARLRRLSPRALQLARAVALAHAPVTARLCALVLSDDPDDPAPAQEAVDAGVLVRHGANGLEFPYPLLRELVLRTTPTATVRDLHDRFAALLTLIGAPAAEIAHHALDAAVPGDGRSVQAIELAMDAARSALTSGTPALAVDLADRALALAPGDVYEAALLVLRGEGRLSTGDVATAVTSFERSLALAHSGEAMLGLGRALQRSGTLVSALEAFERCSGTAADRGRAEVLLALGRVDAAYKAAHDEVVSARAGDDAALLASALANASMVDSVRANPDAVPAAEAAMAAWRTAGEGSLDWPPLFALGMAYTSADRFREALDALWQLRTWLDARGLVDQVPRGVRTETLAAFLSCSWARVQEAVAAAIEVKRDLPNHEMGPVWASAAALAAFRDEEASWQRGIERVENAIARQTTPFDRGLARWWLGIGHLVRLEVEDSHTMLATAADLFRSIGAVDLLGRTYPILSATAAVLGDDAVTAQLHEEYSSFANPDLRKSMEAGLLAIEASGMPTARKRAEMLVRAAQVYRGSEHTFGAVHTTLGAIVIDRRVVPDDLLADVLGLCHTLGVTTAATRLAANA